ncbi:MAG TPA: VanZ family protein [Candidatus Binatus sp.]|jgi:VanZ family protein|nr:VanZ family protein [Candidatus Binatus sp.]
MRSVERWWPALLWAIVISTFSTGIFTSDNTSRIIVPILRWFFPHASQETLFLVHHFIRKMGHVTEYFVLSLLILRAIRAGKPGTHWGWALATIAMVACYASLDEFHQSFVPGRTAAVSDVLIDTAGGIAAQIAVALIVLFADIRRKRRGDRLPPAEPSAMPPH